MARPTMRIAQNVFLLLAFFCTRPLWAQEPASERPADHRPAVSTEEARLNEALSKKGDFSFGDEPLSDVVAGLSEYLSAELFLDVKALEDIGLGTDTPVTINMQGVTARSMLRIMLQQLDLTWVIRDEAIVITTLEAAEAELKDLVYPVADLLRNGKGELNTSDELIELITRIASPDMWDEVGGPGSIVSIYGMLLISQTDEVHQEVQQLLDGYRAVRRMAQQSPDKVTHPSVTCDGTTLDAVRAALDKRHSLDVLESPLSDVVALLSDQSGVNIVLDERALNELGIATDAPVTSRAVKATLRTILNRALRPLDLTYVVGDEVLVITTIDEAESNLQTRFYPVYDLPPSDAFGDEPYGSLMSAITTTVRPNTWDEVGGPASIFAIKDPPVLVVSQTEQGHQQVGELLQKLRLTRQKMGAVADETAVGGKLRLEVYSLAPPQPGAAPVSSQELARVIVRLVEPESWNGKDVVLEQLPGKLVIRHTHRVHYEVQKLLRQLGVGASSAGNVEGGGGAFGGGGFGGGGGAGFFSVP
jgi:uncharacterized membrane protein YgcG